MPTNNAAVKSQYVKIPRYVLEDLRKEAQLIATRDKAPDLESSLGYAKALGACNGGGKIIAATLDVYLEGEVR